MKDSGDTIMYVRLKSNTFVMQSNGELIVGNGKIAITTRSNVDLALMSVILQKMDSGLFLDEFLDGKPSELKETVLRMCRNLIDQGLAESLQKVHVGDPFECLVGISSEGAITEWSRYVQSMCPPFQCMFVKEDSLTHIHVPDNTLAMYFPWHRDANPQRVSEIFHSEVMVITAHEGRDKKVDIHCRKSSVLTKSSSDPITLAYLSGFTEREISWICRASLLYVYYRYYQGINDARKCLTIDVRNGSMQWGTSKGDILL